MGFELPKANNLKQELFNIHNEKEFSRIALAVFHYQYDANSVYQSFCKSVHKTPANVKAVEDIPFLPIQFFKTKEIKCDDFEPDAIFKSSGTTADTRSSHFVKDLAFYRKSFLTCFELFYGSATNYCVIGLLPSYIENGDSSLVYMVDELVKQSRHPSSGFYLYNFEKLHQTLRLLERQKQKTVLFGVSYALLDFAKDFPTSLTDTIVIETGGMKGRKKELTKAELYTQLKSAFSIQEIHSEYGMTELLSQAYAVNGLYQTPPWMRILLREETDPFAFSDRSGIINVVDLANIHSCSFIATDDLGRLHPDGRFEVLGRVDNSDIRGCSQMII